MIENEENLGYTQSANRGLAAGTANFRIMLNSDTIVCENWAIKMLDAAMQSPEIGVVGPLSNAAGVQSVPEIKGGSNNTAINAIPEGITYADIDHFLEKTSLANVIPEVPLVHGFCFGIKREVIDAIGLFDPVRALADIMVKKMTTVLGQLPQDFASPLQQTLLCSTGNLAALTRKSVSFIWVWRVNGCAWFTELKR